MTTIQHVALPSKFGHEIYRCQVGSGVHGTAVQDQDDRDEMGMCIEYPRYVVGLDRFEQWIYRTQPEGVRSGPGDLDLTVFSLRKYMRLALQGNPTVLLPLFAPKKDIVIDTGIGRELRANAARFASRQVAARFLGYMQSQREQMMGLRGKKHTNRPELIEKYGFDTKFAYHMVRLGLQGVELLETGRITLPIPEPDRTWLVDVRLGRVLQSEVLDRATGLEGDLMALRTASALPTSPDRDWANGFLFKAYRRYWSYTEGSRLTSVTQTIR